MTIKLAKHIQLIAHYTYENASAFLTEFIERKIEIKFVLQLE